MERPGEVVTKRELLTRVWPQSVVEESNLKVHVAALRRALCEDGRESRFIATVSGRGYRFVAAVTSNLRSASPEPDPAAWEQIRKLPAPATRTTGRSETIAALLGILQQRRFVSIVGPGGIGKSTVALPVAEAFIAQTGLEICFVELSPLSDGRFVASTIASALGLTIHSGDGMQALLATLRERRLLLVLDSCEHVIDAVAVLVDRILQGTQEVRILATSREPLRTANEYVYRLTPLPYPAQLAPGAALTAAQALAFPAVLLFVLRAAESLDGYQLSDADAPAVAEICRRLEGIPLAIELAATRMDALGAPELAARLGDRFELLQRGRRSALERHRTLADSLDWSYELLPEAERALLRALSVFAGSFTLEDATQLVQNAPSATVNGIANLAEKSLLSADTSGVCVTYRLLDTTKAYALEKLDQCGETNTIRCLHLELYRALFARAFGEWDKLPAPEWLARYARYRDDMRAALAWAFRPGGSNALGMALTVAAIPLWIELSLLEECQQCAERALASGASQNPGDELNLRAAVASSMLYTSGPVPSTEAEWSRVLQLADAQQDREHQLQALWGIAACRGYAGDLPAVRALAARFDSLDALDARIGQRAAPSSMGRLLATAEHYSGDQAAARQRLQQLLAQPAPPPHSTRLARFQLNQHSAILATLANVLWVQGYPDQAAQTAQASLQQARACQHVPSLMYGIANAAFPIMVQIGDHAAAEALLAELADCLKQHAFTVWDKMWCCLSSTLRLMRGDTSAVGELRHAVGLLQQDSYRPRLAWHLGTLAAALDQAGENGAALLLIGDALHLCETGEERWCYAEMLRVKGSLLEAADADAAAKLYQLAQAVALQQGALSWQLRAATSLARLQMRQGALKEARPPLLDVLNQFSEGFGSADLRAARSLLDQPSPG